MINTKNLALVLARRQKRLTYWQQWLTSAATGQKDVDPSESANIQELFATYALLLSKLAKATETKDISDAEERLQALDRKLTTLFESRRLLTNHNGIPAAGDK